MFGQKDKQLRALVQTKLKPGETIEHVAFAEGQMNYLLFVVLLFLAVIPAMIYALYTKRHYVFARTNHRLVILRTRITVFGTPKVQDILEDLSAPLRDMAAKPSKIYINTFFIYLSFGEQAEIMRVMFKSLYSNTNRAAAEAIVDVFTPAVD